MKLELKKTATLLAAAVVAMLLACNSVDSEIKREVEKSNRQRALLSNNECRLDTVLITENRIIEYHFTIVNVVADEVLAQTLKAQEKNIAEALPLAFMQTIKKKGIVLKYFYLDKNGDLITTLTFNHKDLGKQK